MARDGSMLRVSGATKLAATRPQQGAGPRNQRENGLMQKPKIPSPSLDLEMTGEKLMHDTLRIPDGIDAIFDTIVAQVAANLAGEDARSINTVVLSGVGDIYHASLSTEHAFER